ncbi:SMI1/KNR4 family protein [Nocardia sp. NPDC050697]|uniref:SMI1/KNR4 family protein n=1 Tax=Nocardia sp. NPDC050697 TaxID=3155158 RepID=UPI00340AF73F
MPASPIEHSWRRIDSWLAANAPRTFASLRPPADRAAIDAAAAELAVELPADLVAYLRRHDGVAAGEGAFGFPGFQPYGLAEIVRATRMMREISARFDDDLFEGFWHHEFVSIARNVSADGLVVDCRGGAVGEQVEAEGTRFGTWGSLAAFLEQIADCLESGAAMTLGLPYLPVADDGVLLWVPAPEPPPHPRSLLDTAPAVAGPRARIPYRGPGKKWPDVRKSFCLTFAQRLDEAEFLHRFGALPELGQPLPDGPGRWADGPLLPEVRAGVTGEWAFGIEEARFRAEGERDEVLRRVSRGTRAVSLRFSSSNGAIRVSMFDDGKLVTSYDTHRAVLPDGTRDPFDVFPGLPPHDAGAARRNPDSRHIVSVRPDRELAPEQRRERLLAVCAAVVRRCGVPLPPPGLDRGLASAVILPVLPDDDRTVPVPATFAALIDAAPPERLRRVLARQMSSLAAETGLDSYGEVTAALALLSAPDRPGVTDDSALGVRLRRVHAEARAIYVPQDDRFAWQDRAMAARALTGALREPVRDALGLVVALRRDPQWRREFRGQLSGD